MEKLPDGKHVFVTGYSGAGKTTHAQRLAEELGMPIKSLDTDPQYARLHRKGLTRPGPDFNKLVDSARADIVRSAVAESKPHVFEGTQILVNPELTAGHRRVLVDTPAHRAIKQRVRRSFLKEHKDPRLSKVEYRNLAKDLVDLYKGEVGTFRKSPGVEVVKPEVVRDNRVAGYFRPDGKYVRPRVKTAEVPSQEDVYRSASRRLPMSVRWKARHASGGVPDVRGLSDVDIALYSKKPHSLLPKMPAGTVISKQDAERAIYTIPGHGREVNLYATSNRARAKRSVAHRKTALELEKNFPQLVPRVRSLKAKGMGTEKAWATVGGFSDPYETMLNKKNTMDLVRNSIEKKAYMSFFDELKKIGWSDAV